MKGVLLAGGHGTRLGPLTGALSKQLLPVYNKPMVFYPLSVLMLAGIRQILLISTPRHLPLFQDTLGDGADFGIELTYTEQAEPVGLAQAFLLKPDFHNGDTTCLILGDNLIYGSGLRATLRLAREQVESGGAVIFGYPVRDPERYGVVELDAEGHAVDLQEKPKHPRSHLAVPGLYFYDRTVTQRAAALQRPVGGELEITDLNRTYLADDTLHVRVWGRGMTWLDAGTHDSLLEAGQFVQTVESRQATMIGCPEEVGFRQGWLDMWRLRRRAEANPNAYGAYLRRLADMEAGDHTHNIWV